MKNVFLIFLLLLGKVSFSQNHLIIDFKDSVLENFDLKAKFIQYTGSEELILENFKIKDNLKIKIPKNRSGIYGIEIINFGTLFFVLNGKEDKVFQINSSVFNDEISPINDEENQAWRLFNFTVPKILDSKKSFFESWKNKDSEEYKNALDSAKRHYNLEYEKIVQKYPNTYISKYVIPMMIEPICEGTINTPENYRCLRESFIKNWPLDQDEILNSPLFPDRIFYYFSAYSQYKQDGFEQCLLNLLARTNQNEKIKSFIIDFSLYAFLENGPENMALFIYDNFVAGCSEEVYDKSTISKIKKLQNFQIGTVVNDFKVKDYTGKELSFSECYRNGPTLLLFYSSKCQRCWEEIPNIKTLYNKYSKKGLQIVAFAIDSDEKDWRNFIKVNEMEKFYNVSDLLGRESEILKSFFVFSTPTSFLIDSTGKLVLKNPSFYKLNEVLENNY